MKLLEILKDESCWCRKNTAENAAGFSVIPEAEDAIRFSIGGARIKGFEDTPEQNGGWHRLKDIIRRRFPERLDLTIITDFNRHPDTTFADVVSVITEAGI